MLRCPVATSPRQVVRRHSPDPFQPTVTQTQVCDCVCVCFAGRQLPFGLQRPSLRHSRALVSTITESDLSSIMACPASWLQSSACRLHSHAFTAYTISKATDIDSMYSYLFQAPARQVVHHQVAVYAAQSNGSSNGRSSSPYPSNPYADELRATAKSISNRGRGILASDESNITTGKRLASVGRSSGSPLID